MKNRISRFITAVGAICLFAAAWASAGEEIIFEGAQNQVRVSVAIRDAGEESGELVLRFSGENGDKTILRYSLARGARGLEAGVEPLAGGGYSFLRCRVGDDAYVVYSGVVKTDNGQDNRAGLAKENGGIAYEHYNLDGCHRSELGPELFGRLDLIDATGSFELPVAYRDEPTTHYISDPNDVAELYRYLSRRMAEVTGSDRVVKLIISGHSEQDDIGPLVLFTLGEDKQGQFAEIGHFAIGEDGQIYEMDYLNDGKYVPIRSGVILIDGDIPQG